MAYLWDAAYQAEDPGSGQHEFASLLVICRPQRMHYGKVPFEADADNDHGRKIQTKHSEDHHDLAAVIGGVPLNGDPPADLQGDHDEGHDQICGGQMNHHGVQAGFTMPVADQREEHCEVTDCR